MPAPSSRKLGRRGSLDRELLSAEGIRESPRSVSAGTKTEFAIIHAMEGDPKLDDYMSPIGWLQVLTTLQQPRR